MPLIYTIARIYTSEEARCDGRPLYQEIAARVAGLGIPARCHVVKAIAGCFEDGEVATYGVEVFSFHMPIEIQVIMPQSESGRLLPLLEEMVDEGLMTVEDKQVLWHKHSRRMLPGQVRVKDVMTPGPRTLAPGAPASEALRVLACAPFHGIPVVDGQNRPLGMVTHGDLFRRTALPVRPGSFRPFGPVLKEAMGELLAGKTVADLMSRPAVVVREDEQLAKAVDLMLRKDLKRLPAVDAHGTLSGMLSRLDVFKTIMDRTPDWTASDPGGTRLREASLVKDAMRTDTPVLAPSASTWEAIRLIDSTSIKRVAVLDPEGRLLGLISEKVLMAAFSAHKGGILDLLIANLSLPALARKHRELLKAIRARTAGEVMLTDIHSVREDDPIDGALQMMVERRLKRVPVLDADGRFKGMLTRDSLLRSMLEG